MSVSQQIKIYMYCSMYKKKSKMEKNTYLMSVGNIVI